MIPPFFHLFSTVWLHLFSFNILKINNGLNNNDSVDFFPLVYVLRKNQRLKSFYCYWQCWYFLLFRIQFNHDRKKWNQNTHNKTFVTHLHKATIIYHFIEWNMYDAHTKHAQTWWWVALLRRGQFCLFAKLKKKVTYSIAAASKHRNIKTLPTSQYRNTSFSVWRMDLHMTGNLLRCIQQRTAFVTQTIEFVDAIRHFLFSLIFFLLLCIFQNKTNLEESVSLVRFLFIFESRWLWICNRGSNPATHKHTHSL